MRVLMGIIKNSHGVYLARKKVPPALEEAVAKVTTAKRTRVSWLQRSLRTKDVREANIKAKLVLVEFDRTLAAARALAGARQQRGDLSAAELQRMAEYHYAAILEEDDELREDGGSQDVFLSVLDQLRAAGVSATAGFLPETKPQYGLSERDITKTSQALCDALPAAQRALARSDLSHIMPELDDLLEQFGIDLDRKSDAFKKLGVAVLRQHVAALKALQQRQEGEPVDTPKVQSPTGAGGHQGDTLRAALSGWKMVRSRPDGTTREVEHAVKRFVELHGDLPIEAIKKSHVREFREALQNIPVRRSGALLRATLPQLVEWAEKNSGTARISPATVNKLLGGVQAVTVWGRDNGLIPDDVAWADPFSNMRLHAAPPDREPWQLTELQLLFSSGIYVSGDRPKAAGGDAAYWLPLLGLFTGARLGELAQLLATDVCTDTEKSIAYIEFAEDQTVGKRLKTLSSRRLVPVHPELVHLGFLRYVEEQRSGSGRGQLFPLLHRGRNAGQGQQWSKWFGRYIRQLGVERAVFHSFRHGFKDALRAAGESQDINDALTGHSGAGVGHTYGAKEMVRRFGLRRLADAVGKVAYPGLDLSHLVKGKWGG